MFFVADLGGAIFEQGLYSSGGYTRAFTVCGRKKIFKKSEHKNPSLIRDQKFSGYIIEKSFCMKYIKKLFSQIISFQNPDHC